MPERILKPILAFLSPSSPPHWAVTLALSTLAAIATWFAGLPPITQIFGYAMLFDYLTGAEAAEQLGFWEWRKGIKGLISKCVFGALNLILLKISILSGPGGATLYNALTLAMCVNEGKSGLDNLKRRGYSSAPIFEAVLSRITIISESRIRAAVPAKPEEPDSSKQENGHG